MKNIDAVTLQDKLGNLKNSELMRSIIMNEKEFCTCKYERSLRSFWYSNVKPVLDKLNKLDSQDMTETGLTKWDKTLSKYLVELVKEGYLSYKDLMIVDESRKKNIPDFGYYPNVVVAVEKDTIYNQIKDIAGLLGCSCISSKGMNSLSGIEDLLRRIKDSCYNDSQEIYFLILSDYDPAGFAIANSFKAQAEELLPVLNMEDYNIHSERIGILPSQLSSDELENNMYSPKGNMDLWLSQTGGINGEPKGLELDALEPERIREIFADSLEKYIETKVYINELKEDYLRNLVLDEIKSYIDEIIKKVLEEKNQDVVVEDFDILDLVRQGCRWIPMSLCSLPDNNISSLVGNYFN